MNLSPEHRRAVRNETIVSTAINSLIPAAVIWLIDLIPPDSLVGENGIVRPMAKAAGLATLLMTFAITALVRARVRKGTLPPLERAGAIGALPGNLALRGIVVAALALVLLVPAGLAIVALLDILPLDRTGFLLFNLLFGAAVGIVMTRFVVLRALADPVRR